LFIPDFPNVPQKYTNTSLIFIVYQHSYTVFWMNRNCSNSYSCSSRQWDVRNT